MKHNFLEPTRKPKVIYIDIPRIRHKSVKLTMELLKRKRRHLTVQKDLGLLNSGMLNRGEVPFITVAVDQSTVKLVEATKTHRSQLNEIAENSGTLNRGRNLCVTVAIDHLTVDGFHDELQLSAKNTKGKALRRISWVKGFHLVRWNDYHSISACNRLKFHQFGSTVLHESLLEYVWYAGEKFGNELLCKQTLSRWTTIDASEFHNIKLNAKEMISPKLVTIPKNRRWTLKIYWRRSGSENSNLDKVPSKIEEKLKKTFMENQTGSHHRPKQEVIAHQHGLYRAQRYPDQNRFEKYLGKLVMNFFNKQTYAVYYR